MLRFKCGVRYSLPLSCNEFIKAGIPLERIKLIAEMIGDRYDIFCSIQSGMFKDDVVIKARQEAECIKIKDLLEYYLNLIIEGRAS